MKITLISITLALLFSGRAIAQEKKANEAAEKPKNVSGQASEPQKPAAADAEARFKALLTNVTWILFCKS